MECCIAAHDLKVFARSIHCLSKIGDDVNFEVKADRLELRAVNQSRSAFAYFSFAQSFFEFYHLTVKDSTLEGTGCRLTCKALLSAFKSLKAINQSVERCFITLAEEEARLVVKLQCRHGIVKTHQLYFEDCETLTAVYNKEDCRSVVAAAPHVISEGVANFQAGLEEISFQASREKLQLSNYMEIGPEADTTECLNTRLSLDPSEFSRYDVRRDVNLVFCLKELKALLVFVDYVSEALSMHFDRSGRPIIFSQEARHHKADFVFATLDNGDEEDDDEDDDDDMAVRQTPGGTLSQYTPRPPSPMQLDNQQRQMDDDGVTPSLLDPNTMDMSAKQQTPYMTSSINAIAPSYKRVQSQTQDEDSPELNMPSVGSATNTQGKGQLAETDDEEEDNIASTPPRRVGGLRKAVSDTVMELSVELDGKLCADTDDDDED